MFVNFPYLEGKKLDNNGMLAVFCGSGISRNSGMPMVNVLIQYIIQKLGIDTVDEDVILKSDLPFEAIMEILSRTLDIEDIIKAYQFGEPNADHILIARLARLGVVRKIYTTNFDELIEKALDLEGLKDKYITYSNETDFSTVNLAAEEEKITVFKIHGTASHPDSARAVINKISSNYLYNMRSRIITHAFSGGRHSTILVLGYSCSDMLDILPAIESLDNNWKEVIFIDHHSDKGVEIEEIGKKSIKNPFQKFPENCKRIYCNTDEFIAEFWKQNIDVIGTFQVSQQSHDWKKQVDKWLDVVESHKGVNYFILGSLFFNVSDFNRALKYFNTSLDIQVNGKNITGQINCYLGQGNSLSELDRYSEALVAYEHAQNLAEQCSDDLLRLQCYGNIGNIYYDDKNYPKAREYYNKSLKISLKTKNYSSIVHDYYSLGNISHITGNFESAIDYYNKSIEIARHYGYKKLEAVSHRGLGQVYLEQKQLSQAIASFETSMNIAGQISYRKLELLSASRLNEIFEIMEKATQYYKEGMEYDKAERTDDAIIAYRKAIALNPEDINAHLNLGNSFMSKSLYDEAIEEYETALKIKPDYAKAYCNIGSVLLYKKQYKESIEKYRDALKIDPNFPQAHENLANIYIEIGLKDKAINELKTLLKCSPQNMSSDEFLHYSVVRYKLASLLKEEGKTDESIFEYRILIDQVPEFAQAHYDYGQLLEKKGHYSKAVKEYRIALKIEPELIDVEQRINSLKEKKDNFSGYQLFGKTFEKK
ncbi:tetratricopeptide repeat protein [Methanosarcina sp. DH1]|uniref:tetratricopeptide repeat protein n=1 Tax=Methanosarcina sp. DH1 TaxID=2605695 RepID=UPI001E5F7983|nr:tetratricopeptide repeat protein [Methanosarcina sp. DH1]MCC4765730.1 tetratricopeptide repeat protein [Methanosarcina sp. DH1]